MKTFILCAAVAAFFTVRSQESYHVVPEGSHWLIETTDIGVRGLTEISYVGDDEIGGAWCQKLELQSYTRWSNNMSWGPIITNQSVNLFVRKNGAQVEIFRDSTWNLLYKTQTYIGEVWYQGLAWNGNEIHVKVVAVDESEGSIYTQACDSNGVIYEPFTQEFNNAYGPFWGVYNVHYISQRMDLVNHFDKLNFIYCPVLNYACFNGSTLIGQSCQSDFMTLSNPDFEQFDATMLHPNPSARGFNVSSNADFFNVTLYNSSGMKVAHFEAVDSQQYLDLHHLSAGVYSVIVQTNSSVKTLFWFRTE